MGRWSFGVLCFAGVISASLAVTYPGYSFLSSESRNYPPAPSYHEPKTSPSFTSFEVTGGISGSTAPRSHAPRPIVRKLRGAHYYSHGHHDHHDYHDHDHHHAHVVAPTVYINKAPLYYPEASVFSEPLPIVQLPQLPAEFLTLKSTSVNTGAYGGSENEVPKKSKKARKSKSGRTTTTPAPEEDEEDVQETEDDSEAQGGYPASKSRDTESEGGYSASGSRNTEAEGGYPASGSRNTEAEGGYPSSGSKQIKADEQGGYQQQPRQRQRSRPRQKEESSDAAAEGEVSGGYPSSFDANQGSQPAQRSPAGSRSRSRARGNRNKYESDEENTAGETEADDEDTDEIMMTGDDAEDDREDTAAEVDDDAEEEEVTGAPKRGKSGRKGGKKRGRSGSRGKGKADDDESSALNAALADQGQKIDSFFVPTFGNSVLNTVYPAFSQNALLRSLDAQTDNGYPESGRDVSAISITNEDEESAKGRKKSRKSKKRTSPRRKNRPASRGRSGRRGGSKNKQASPARAQEPSQQYGAPQGNQFSQPQQQYGSPQRFAQPQEQYGAPSQGGISPPAQNEGGYKTINNELRQRTSDVPQQFRQEPQQQYGAPSSGGGRFIEPRQLSQATIVRGDSQQFSNDANNPVTQDLIRTVQAILEKYPN